MMLNLIKDHWLCFLIGGVVGWSLHLCPLFCVCAGKCPVAGQHPAACACDACACDVCDCDDTGCNCPSCVK